MSRFGWPLAMGAIALALGCGPRPAADVLVSPSPSAAPSPTPAIESPRPSPSPTTDLYPALYEALHRPSLPFKLLPFAGLAWGEIKVYRSMGDVEADYHSPYISYVTPPTMPPVDFAKEMMITVHVDMSTLEKPEIVGVEDQEYGLLIRIVRWGTDPTDEPMPSTDGAFIQTVVVPRSDKPVVMGQILSAPIGLRKSLFKTPPDPETPPLPLPGPLYPSTYPSPFPSPGQE